MKYLFLSIFLCAAFLCKAQSSTDSMQWVKFPNGCLKMRIADSSLNVAADIDCDGSMTIYDSLATIKTLLSILAKYRETEQALHAAQAVISNIKSDGTIPEKSYFKSAYENYKSFIQNLQQ